MIYKGDVEIKIPQSMYENVSLSINDSSVKNLSVSLTPMEFRCSECHKIFNDKDDTIVIINSKASLNSSIKLSSENLFVIHKECLSEFISSYLNNQEREEEKEQEKEQE